MGCSNTKKKEILQRDWDQILQTKELTIITLNTSTTYFIYKDEPMGYDYDLIKDFCNEYGINLKVKVAENSTKLVQMLLNREGDLIAAPVIVQNALKDSIQYCGVTTLSHQVLVQRNVPKDSIIKDVTQLIGKEVYVKNNTQYYHRLKNLDDELGGGIEIKDIERDTVTVEDLIEMVAYSQIDYTISDDYIAKLNKTYYHDIDISMPLSFDQRSSWAVRKDQPKLAEALDKWFSKNSKTPIYKTTSKKYFELSKMQVGSDVVALIGDLLKELPEGSISPFDDIFKRYSPLCGYDWQLLAAIAFQESRFKVDLTSWAGASGLMGLMPRTAASFGVSKDDLANPNVSVMTSANLLKRLNNIFVKIVDPEQKMKFVLAAYNGGNGHVADAQALARKYGDDPYLWDGSVEKYIALKSNPEYYNDPVCKSGYLRSSEVLSYVDQVIANWQKFKIQSIN